MEPRNDVIHTCSDTRSAFHLLDAGVAIETVAALLFGHTSVKTTERHYKAHTQIT